MDISLFLFDFITRNDVIKSLQVDLNYWAYNLKNHLRDVQGKNQIANRLGQTVNLDISANMDRLHF